MTDDPWKLDTIRGVSHRKGGRVFIVRTDGSTEQVPPEDVDRFLDAYGREPALDEPLSEEKEREMREFLGRFDPRPGRIGGGR